MQRHDLLMLTACEMQKQLSTIGFNESIPAIVRMQEHEISNELDVGFSFPWFNEGHRVRLSTTVNKKEIIRVISPYDWNKQPLDLPDNKWMYYLKKLESLAEKNQITLGIYGSLQLELVTGLPYLHETSDIDITIMAAPYERMEQFYHQMIDEAKKCGVKTDLEVRIEGGDVKAQELFSTQQTVLVRGLYGMWLHNRNDIENLYKSSYKTLK